MNAALRRSRFPLILVVVLIWIGLYLWMMGSADWPWSSKGPDGAVGSVLGFGTVPSGTLTRFGSAVPPRIHNGDWQRMFTGAALHGSLVGLLLAGWWWASLAKGMRGLVGVGATVLVMIAGGAAGNFVHAKVYPDTPFAGPGPFGWVAALIGLQMGLGLFGGLVHGRRLVFSSIFSLLFVGLFMWLQDAHKAMSSDWFRPALGLEALGASFGVGVVTPLLMGAKTFARQSNMFVKPFAWVAVLAWVGAMAVQLPRAVRAGEAGDVRVFLKALQDAEVDARSLFDDGREARRYKRTALHESLNALREHAFASQLSDRALLQAYVKAMRPIASGDMPDPHAVLVRCRRALKVWHDKVEVPLRRDYGLPPRAPHRVRRWDSL